MRTFLSLSAAVLLAAPLAACGHQSAAAAEGFSAIPAMPFEISVKLPKRTIGEELPSEGVGSRRDPEWGKIGGFTQTSKAQVLAFPPNTEVTIRNLSKNTPHTLDFVGDAGKPPAKFPPNPTLSISAHGHGIFGPGYASGNINPGASVKVKLAHKGKYLIGCAYHYSFGMRDVLIVEAHATPGPDAPR